MGLGDERGPQLAVVLAVASNKASLAIGTSARQQIQPLRQLLLLSAFSGECNPPQRLSQAPWSISDDALLAVLAGTGLVAGQDSRTAGSAVRKEADPNAARAAPLRLRS